MKTLDGDEVRENLSRGLGFSEQDRNTNIRRIGFVARLLARNGVVVLGAISPYRQSRDDVRLGIEHDDVPFIEVFVRCPLETLVERNVKGLYAKALAREIDHVTGISDPYEERLRRKSSLIARSNRSNRAQKKSCRRFSVLARSTITPHRLKSAPLREKE